MPPVSEPADASLRIRPETPADSAAIDEVVGRAFEGPVEVELVRNIRASANYVAKFSLVATRAGAVIGHVMLSYVELDDGSSRHRVLSLAPVAVMPEAQKQGVGSTLIRAALRAADADGEPMVILEGSPVYYGRLGFSDSRDSGIHFALPDWAPREAGQVYKLSTYHHAIKGNVVYPPAFPTTAE